LWGRDLDVLFLVKDGMLKQSSKQFQNAANFPPTEFVLTPKGKEFIQRWHSIDPLDQARKARE
jgi:hypothetical protein